MAVIINTNQDLIDAVNAAGFETIEQFVKFMQIGRLQTNIGALEVANKVLDAQTGAVQQANESLKQQNTTAMETLKAQLAALVNS